MWCRLGSNQWTLTIQLIEIWNRFVFEILLEIMHGSFKFNDFDPYVDLGQGEIGYLGLGA